MIRLTLKTKIWFTVLTIVLMFSFFLLLYFPAQQQKVLMDNYGKEVQNLANTVALGVKIALTEQNFEGVQTAMDFVKNDPRLKFVSMHQVDTTWSEDRKNFTTERTVFKTYPENLPENLPIESTDTTVIKTAAFTSDTFNGEIVLGFNTSEIMLSKKQIRTTSVLVSVFVFLIGILLGFWLARNISIPVIELREAAIKVGAGDRTQRVITRANDEIGELGQAFNKMVRDLSKAEDELMLVNQNLETTNKNLNETVDELRSTQAQLVQAEKMASLGQLTAGIAHEIQNPLNFVNNFSESAIDLLNDLRTEEDAEERNVINTDLVKVLEKIHHHGKRADQIVKNMLLHSREQGDEKVLTDINVLLREFIQLAYHGFRASHPGIDCRIIENFAEDLPLIPTRSQDLGRVFLNLAGNTFYAVYAKLQVEPKGSYDPKLEVTTKCEDGIIYITLKDNGTGIPQHVISRIFDPFFTTKPAGKGTGLGLSISYDVIKTHGGTMTVESEENQFTKFTIRLPVPDLSA